MSLLTTTLETFAVRLHYDEGATAVEYALMVALVAVVIIGAVQAIGVNLTAVFTNVVLNTALGGGGS